MSGYEAALVKIVTEVVKRLQQYAKEPLVPIGVSNRHIHVSQRDLESLFGDGHQLTKLRDLKQPGQYAAKEVVIVSGPKGTLEGVRILGPVREETQLEISLTDGFKLGIHAPVRESGKTDETPGITIKGPVGTVKKSKGVIAALRHIHMPPDFARQYGLKDKELVTVEVGDERKTLFENVLLRVSENFALEMHLDTDEANAAGVATDDLAKIIIKRP